MMTKKARNPILEFTAFRGCSNAKTSLKPPRFEIDYACENLQHANEERNKGNRGRDSQAYDLLLDGKQK